ncbi:transcriptional regulator [Streptomyces sp. Ru73]|uniref:LCP family protein n=1 Tax=Streptomyces sp. Ru73 TaxID=2080748 RepID=UPI000CDD3B69|nr:LCP family protein [Streptomyces sp. Ru73]POX37476.1 transcriptional regulator [Streptomyces sp. Ru73]
MPGSHTARADRRPSRRAARRARRKRGRGRVLAATALSLLLLVAAGAGWVYLRLNGDISTFGADGLSRDRPGASAGGQNVLVIGSDSRSGDNSRLGGGKGDIGRSDTAFLMHIYGDSRHAVAVSFPRDTLVDIPACKLPDGTWTEPRTDAMFNSAFTVGDTAQGNPACTQNTVEHLTGLRVDHTVVVDFAGFAKMTDAVGGVPVCLPKDIYQGDLNPHRGSRGKRLFAKGPQTVSGQQALDYVRLRHGIGDGSDIGRIKRQQAFVAALVKKIKEDGLTPTHLMPLAEAATSAMTVDPGLGTADKLISFAMSLQDIDLHNTKFLTLPWRYQGARVAIQHPQADELWAALRADRTVDGKDASGKSGDGKAKEKRPAVSPTASEPVNGAGISVTVYNGTTTSGLAARAAETLKGDGFTVGGTATAETQDLATTEIRYGPGQEARARTVARVFPGARLTSVADNGITVTLGRDYADAPRPGASSDLSEQVGDTARTADDNPCSNLSYG